MTGAVIYLVATTAQLSGHQVNTLSLMQYK